MGRFSTFKAAGFTDGLHAGEISHNFFSAELFGLDVPLERVVRYFETRTLTPFAAFTMRVATTLGCA